MSGAGDSGPEEKADSPGGDLRGRSSGPRPPPTDEPDRSLPRGPEEPLIRRLQRLWRELRARRVPHVATAYLGVAWLGMQLCNILIDRDLLPEWTFSVLLFFLVVGFPVTLLLAWAQTQERVPDRASGRAAAGPGGEGGREPRWPGWILRIRSGHLLAALGVALVAVGAAWFGIVGGSWAGSSPGSGSELKIMVLPLEGRGVSSGTTGAGTGDVERLFVSSVEWLLQAPVLHGSGLLDGEGRGEPTVSWLVRQSRRRGADYLVTGEIVRTGGQERISVTAYPTAGETPVYQGVSGGREEPLSKAAGRLAYDLVSLLARRHGLDLGRRGEIAAATPSHVARVQLLLGQRRFWDGDLDGAAAAFRQAIEADSAAGVAYHRLSVVEHWRWNYGNALEVLRAGLGRRGEMDPRRARLLEAQRHYVLNQADSTVEAFQQVVSDLPESPDGWLGLGEALFHFGGIAGHCPLEARSAFQQLLRLDSTFAPVHYHLVELALIAGDSAAASRHLAHLRPDHPQAPSLRAAVNLHFGDDRTRARALEELARLQRRELSLLAAVFTRGAFDLPLADTIASYLQDEDTRTPDSRRRGAQYRMVAMAGQGRWEEALEAWRPEGAGHPFDRWIVQAALAGFPAETLAAPMYRWARQQLRAGRTPDFSLPPDSELRQAFRALVHRASLTGDSVEVAALLETLSAASETVRDPTEPMPAALGAALRARLRLLAADTAEAVDHLEEAAFRSSHPYAVYYPLTAMTPQRFLLLELALRRGDRHPARQWFRSFLNPWPIMGDALYAPKLRELVQEGRVAPECGSTFPSLRENQP